MRYEEANELLVKIVAADVSMDVIGSGMDKALKEFMIDQDHVKYSKAMVNAVRVGYHGTTPTLVAFTRHLLTTIDLGKLIAAGLEEEASRISTALSAISTED